MLWQRRRLEQRFGLRSMLIRFASFRLRQRVQLLVDEILEFVTTDDDSILLRFALRRSEVADDS